MKFSLSKITNAITNKAGRTGLKIQNASPDILVVAGIVGVVAATVMACKQTKKLDDILDEHNEEINSIKTEHEVVSDIVDEDGEPVETSSEDSEVAYRTSIAKTYMTTGLKVLRLYGPTIVLYGVSIGCILKSHSILKQRNLAAYMAYEAVDSTFKKYRDRVVEKYGEEEDRNLRYGRYSEDVEDVKQDPETGEEVTETLKKDFYDIPDGCNGDYGFWFSKETCPNVFDGDPVHDLALARGIQAVFETTLNGRGHVILHEVVDQFGLDRRGQDIVAGWVTGNGDDHISLGIDDGYIFARDEFGRAVLVDPNDPEERQLLRNGFWIEPNVDGIIFDKI